MEKSERTDRRFAAVAIGSSAGGVRALMQVLSAFPKQFPASVLVVQHLDPHIASRLVEIMSRHAAMPVTQARDGQRIEAGVIYIAPPGKHMLVEERHIRLTTTELVHFVRPSVDLLFESVAAAYESSAIGVILTGSGLDGALGIQAIRANGGFTIVQDPLTAESTGMPSAAIRTGAVDLVLQLERIGPTITEYVMGGKPRPIP